MDAVNWIKLPEQIWISILQHLDVKSMLRASETCTMLSNLVEIKKLTDRIKLSFVLTPYIKNDVTEAAKKIMEVFGNSNRDYKTVEFDFLQKSIFAEPAPRFYKVALGKSIQIIKMFSYSVRNVHFKNFQGDDRPCKKALKKDKNLRIRYFSINMGCKKELDSMCFRDFMRYAMFTPSCDQLCMKDIVNDSEMGQFDHVRVIRLEIAGRFTKPYEQFLLKEENLENLTASTTEMFENNALSNVKFTLNFMNLSDSKWTNKKNALNFIRTQTGLEFVKIKLDKDQYDIAFLKHIINANRCVISLSLELEGCDSEFEQEIYQLQQNTFVRHLSFTCVPANRNLSRRFMALFPHQIDLMNLKFYE